MNELQRFTIVMLDSLGVGEQPDAHKFGQSGCNTIKTVADHIGGISLPNLQGLGLGNLTEILGVPANMNAQAAYGRMKEESAGNDTFAGIWEMVGLLYHQRFTAYASGLPPSLVARIQNAIGREVVGNRYESGPEIIRRCANEHIATSFPILYTSDDGVVQIAAHVDVIAPPDLYRMAERIAEALRGYGVARVITRPFVGKEGNFKRTNQRVDFPVLSDVTDETLLDLAARNGIPFIATNHVRDLLSVKPITESIPISDNNDGINELINRLNQDFRGIMFFGLLDLDDCGHRKDLVGYARALHSFDIRIPEILRALHVYDMLLIVADHGTNLLCGAYDHTREYVPLFVLGPRVRRGVDLGIRQTFADLGQTIADVLSIGRLKHGQSFKSSILLEHLDET